MGQAPRSKPKRLAGKLVRIRETLGLSQNEMIRHLQLAEKLSRENISTFERGLREPSLLVLLRYARAAGVWMDVLVDDELDLPAKLPTREKHQGIRRQSASSKAKLKDS